MNRAAILGFFLTALMYASAAAANGTLMPLREQFQRADLVAVGRLGEPTSCIAGSMQRPCAEIFVDAAFKSDGSPSRLKRYLILDFGVRELSVEDVRVPGRALLLLIKIEFENGDNPSGDAVYYRAVAARLSILPIDDSGLIFGNYRPN